MENREETIEERYGKLEAKKKDYMDRAERNAKLTLPYLFPIVGFKSGDEQDYFYSQGYNGSLVSHLAGKLRSAILPDNKPFFRIEASREALNELSQNDPSAKYEIKKTTSLVEDKVLKSINAKNPIPHIRQALELGIITGNAIIEFLDTNNMNGHHYKVFNLRSYVVRRDYSGVIEELIIKEAMDYETLPEDIRNQVSEEDIKEDEDMYLYTSNKLVDGKYVLTQEIVGKPVGKEITYDNITDRYIDFTWDLLDGEDYARSYVDKFYTTMALLEKSKKIFTEGIAENVKVIKFLNRNGSTNEEDYVNAKHGETIMGTAADVTVEEGRKTVSLDVMNNMVQSLKQDLAKIFLVAGQGVRDSERTTAYEVGLLAKEAEQALDSFYSSVSQKVQKPLVMRELKN